MNKRELQKLATYKDMAYRSIRFLCRVVGTKKVRGWVEVWITEFEKGEQK